MTYLFCHTHIPLLLYLHWTALMARQWTPLTYLGNRFMCTLSFFTWVYHP
jgi:hypothetical protein